jgi:uncharacterized protein with PIN domain
VRLEDGGWSIKECCDKTVRSTTGTPSSATYNSSASTPASSPPRFTASIRFYADAELAHISSSQRRILLTRDRALLKRSVVTHGYCIRSTNPRQQLTEVLRRFDLFGSLLPFSRCLYCNGLLQTVDKEAVSDRLPPKTKQYYDEFRRCRNCERI